MSDNHGKVWWNELNTRDVEGAKAYYAATLGWSFDTMPMPETGGDYTVAKMGDQMVGGMFDITGMPGMDEVPPHWFTYFAVDDVDAAAAATEAAGGSIQRPSFDVEGVGRIAIVQDPTGAMLGLMTPSD